MQLRTLALAAALIAAFPLANAHDPAGTPKNYCEDPFEWGVHDYGPPADGTLIALGSDSNLAGDCDGDGVPADFDGHVEYALGGGWLDVETGDGVTGGTQACYGVLGHHPFFGPITVNDAVLGQTVAFSVTADTINIIPPTDPAAPNCGDFEADESTTCVGTCSVTFPPGLDGTYPIFVGDATTGAVGTLGHIVTGVTPLPPPPPTPSGHVTLHRFPGGTGLNVRFITPGWSCVDKNTGDPATLYSTVSGPNPGVDCTWSGPTARCNTVSAGGAHASVGSGSLDVTSECVGLDVTAHLVLPFTGGVAASASGTGTANPWRCSADLSSLDPQADVWFFCQVNL